MPFDEIYETTHKAVLAFIIAKCGRITDVSDIFQETYLELHTLLVKRGVAYVIDAKALVMRLARQKIARHYTFMERIKQRMAITKPDEDADDILAHEADAFLTEEWVVTSLMYEAARTVLRGKPVGVQRVFALTYHVGLTLAETAQVLGISESTVKSRLYRTLKELRTALG